MVDLSKVSACLITKDSVYPQVILEYMRLFPFGEFLVGTNCNTPYMKHLLFKRAKYELLYYSDDDCIAPINELATNSNPNMINVAMKPSHFESYKNTRMTMGLGWGSIFHKRILQSLKKYTDIYGYDEIFQRETERILTYLNYPQNRLILPIIDLPSAYNEDRLWRQPQHYDNIQIVEERCKPLI